MTTITYPPELLPSPDNGDEVEVVVVGGEWRPIATAPKDESILVFLPDAAPGLEIVIAYCASDDPDGDWYPTTPDGGRPIDVSVSHRMPLPPFPSGFSA